MTNNYSSNGTSNVIELSSIRFPIGAKVWHDKYRICQIVKSAGDERTIRIVVPGKMENVVEYVTVHANELKTITMPPELK